MTTRWFLFLDLVGLIRDLEVAYFWEVVVFRNKSGRRNASADGYEGRFPSPFSICNSRFNRAGVRHDWLPYLLRRWEGARRSGLIVLGLALSRKLPAAPRNYCNFPRVPIRAERGRIQYSDSWSLIGKFRFVNVAFRAQGWSFARMLIIIGVIKYKSSFNTTSCDALRVGPRLFINLESLVDRYNSLAICLCRVWEIPPSR